MGTFKSQVFRFGQTKVTLAAHPCEQLRFTLSSAGLQIPCSFVEEDARSCPRRISEVLQITTGGKGIRGRLRKSIVSSR